MTNQIETFIRFHSFSAFCPMFTSFCLIACLPNVGPPYSMIWFQNMSGIQNGNLKKIPIDQKYFQVQTDDQILKLEKRIFNRYQPAFSEGKILEKRHAP